ncbi:hypothetical protein V2E25_01180 [Mycoplasmopsis arginini]|uniref:Uncharacterized protein n=1 Tax=Mycoplasmopsis arginini TaxID=2094 RepID=A0ABZ2ANA9_MYCAR|nr:hypothetical protein [Mycoplasmopsis arginini]WVN22194.1 hypothetical protein V2E25_01180 [Mycoplasmopsis arginini]VEU81601.1 Uncharacterised protein [Mycoplasmopsis arginini]VEU83394.1 Uncharacterised protein [Mycoplasmopsis arginini]
MELIKIVDRLEQKLLKYKPLVDIYYVDRHAFSFDGVVELNELVLDNWNKICNNFVNILSVLGEYIDN